MDNPAEPGVIRRVALSYAADLVAAISAVLLCGRLLMPLPNTAGVAPIVPYAVSDAIDRFTPFGLWQIYQDIIADSVQAFTHSVAGPLPALLIGLRMIGTLFVAVPQAVLTIYGESDGIDTWVCFAAFIVTVMTFALSLSGGRPSPLRLLLAAALAPALTSVLFWLAQQTLLDAVNTLDWFARLAPWCLPCPLLCTLWWVFFPRAQHGATATLLLFTQRCWGTYFRRRRTIRREAVGTRPH